MSLATVPGATCPVCAAAVASVELEAGVRELEPVDGWRTVEHDSGQDRATFDCGDVIVGRTIRDVVGPLIGRT